MSLEAGLLYQQIFIIRIKEAQRISREIMEQTGFAPTDEKLAQELGISIG